jgi:hypothetical protein
MSSASMNGSARPGSARKATSPVRTGSRKKLSLKFWAMKAERTMVQSAPDCCRACSLRSAPSSPRPDSSTSRRTPVATASSANAPTAAAAPGIATSG